MEVSGKMADDTKLNLDLYCLPCDQDGHKVSAYGYCQDCQEHLCKTCYEHHRRPKPSRNHILLDKDAMPQQLVSVDKNEDNITDVCSKHRDKLLDFYCNDHKAVLCYVCFTLEHKQCKAIYIPDISGNLSAELVDLNTKMNFLVKKCESNIKRTDTTLKQLHKSRRKALEEITIFRKEINERLDQMQAVLIRQVENLANEAKRKLLNIKSVCSEIAHEVKRSKSILNSLNEENKHTKLFIQMKSAEPSLTTLVYKERQTIDDNRTNDAIKFDRNRQIIEQLKIGNNFGAISIHVKPSADRKVCVQYERSHCVKYSSDKLQADIFGMVTISSSQIIVIDKENEKIKMIDRDTGTLVSEKILSSAPQDVIKLPQNKLGIALPNRSSVQVMSYSDTNLSLDREINVGESCFCIAYCQEKLVIGCGNYKGKLVVLDLANGKVLQVFDIPGLLSPQKVVISSDQRFLYVSDYLTSSKCIKVDWQGVDVRRYEDKNYVFPKGIQEIDDGTMLVCYKNSHNIVRLSSDFEKCMILGLEKANLYNPRTLTYSERYQKLYVSCSSERKYSKNDTIKVLSVTWKYEL